MSISAISFGRTPKVPVNKETKNIKQTKQGNPYYHTNTGKKVGLALGVGVGLATAVITGIMTKSFKVGSTIGALKSIGPVLYGVVGGAIADGYVNHNEKKKADQMAAYKA